MDKHSLPILSLYSIKKAAATLDEAMLEFGKDPENNLIRDACIQRFEYTYEISTKILRRYLELTEANSGEITTLSFPDLVRLGSKRGILLNDWEKWTVYRNARNATSHTYDENKAKHVVKAIPAFIEDVKFLIEKIDLALKKS